jgi:hypothetical protein
VGPNVSLDEVEERRILTLPGLMNILESIDFPVRTAEHRLMSTECLQEICSAEGSASYTVLVKSSLITRK